MTLHRLVDEQHGPGSASSLSVELFENHNKQHCRQYDTHIVNNSQSRRRIVISVYIRSQDLGTDKRSDQRPLGSGEIAFEKIFSDIIPKKVKAKSAPADGDDIRYYKGGEQHT